MADSDLPVFSFRANWREPMAERLAFLTDVLAASEGAEQRRSVRQTPRRSFEADFLLTSRERTFWDLFINALGGGEVVAPLYWEVVTIPATLTATVSDRIDFDTTLREWAYHEGYLALLIRDSALDYEVVEIASVDAGGVDLAAPPIRPWPKGTKLLPLRRAVLDQIGDVEQPSAGVGRVTAELRIVGPNPWTPAADASPVYGGLPVFLSEPNWVENLTVQQDREIDLLDTGVGLTYQVDATGRVLLGQAHRWFLPGKTKLAEFRDLIYRHRGRAGAFWLPTFKADLRLVAAAGSGATQIEVENVGYGYTGGPTSGREYIAIKHSGGTILRKVLSVIPGTTTATEKLNLDAALGLALSPGQVLRISFADVARFDTDEFEIVHYGGVEAHHDASALFRTFKNTRTSPDPIHFPVSPGVMNETACGGGTEYTFFFSDNLPFMTDGDTFNSGAYERANITLQMGLIGGGSSLRYEEITVSSVYRAENPQFNECWNTLISTDAGRVSYKYFPDSKILSVWLSEGVTLYTHRFFTQGNISSWDGEPWDIVKHVNGSFAPWTSTSGPNPTGGSGFNGNPDFDDILMFFNG